MYNATTDPSGLSLTLDYQSSYCNSGCGTIRSLSVVLYFQSETLNIYNGNSTSAALMASLGSTRYTPGSLT